MAAGNSNCLKVGGKKQHWVWSEHLLISRCVPQARHSNCKYFIVSIYLIPVFYVYVKISEKIKDILMRKIKLRGSTYC